MPSRSWKIAPLAAVLGAIACATQNVPARGVIDGKLANLGSYNRTLSGTWSDGATNGDFKLTRD